MFRHAIYATVLVLSATTMASAQSNNKKNFSINFSGSRPNGAQYSVTIGNQNGQTSGSFTVVGPNGNVISGNFSPPHMPMQPVPYNPNPGYFNPPAQPYIAPQPYVQPYVNPSPNNWINNTPGALPPFVTPSNPNPIVPQYAPPQNNGNNSNSGGVMTLRSGRTLRR